MNVFESPLFQKQAEEVAAATAARQTATHAERQQRGNMRGMAQRMYAAAKVNRLNAGFSGSNSSADAELVSSIMTVRSRSRALCRDSSYAKRAKLIVVNNVIGTGIGMQAQVGTERGGLNARVNDAIEAAWCTWSEADNCHTGGRLSFKHFERAVMAQVFEAGEVFIRKHRQPFGKMGVPFALELIEAERLADQFVSVPFAIRSPNHVRLGVEVDRFFRPVAYYFRQRHQGEIRLDAYGSDMIERVPADQVIHLAVIDRWPQTRGEPWLHTAALRLNDMDGYSEAEIVRARAQAVRMGIIETPDSTGNLADEELEDGSYEMTLESGMVERLNPGEKWHDSNPSAPNPNMDPFMRYMLREVAAGIGVSYESISKDYSQSNYSSSRLAILDDRDLWRFYQSWFICDFRQQIHREWLQWAVYAGKVEGLTLDQYLPNKDKFDAVLFKPRGWTWIDPTKEVEAYKEAIRAGFTTRTDVIASTAGGQDIEDIDNTRKRELEQAAEKKLKFDTDPEYYMSDAAKAVAEAKSIAKAASKPPDEGDDKSTSAPPRAGRIVFGVVK